MDLLQTRVFITAIATLIALIGTISIYFIPQHATLVLTIEVILLPSIYVIGNYIAEQRIGEKYNEDLDKLSLLTYQLNERYIKLYERYIGEKSKD